MLDVNDTINFPELDEDWIDRHGCGYVPLTNRTNYANMNGNKTVGLLLCTVGANDGQGVGFSEVYETLANGTVVKNINASLSFAKHPTMRSRSVTPLRGPNGTDLVFVGVKGQKGTRPDGNFNTHIMLALDYQVNKNASKWFTEVQPNNSPWKVQTEALSVLAVDITGNGVDDLIVCHQPGGGSIYTQSKTGIWSQQSLPNGRTTAKLQSARLADITGDGRQDLVAVNRGEQGSRLYIFKGQVTAPYFDFRNPWYQRALPYAAPDVEVLDVNGDGLLDVYVVQSNETLGYCNGKNVSNYWGGTREPNASFVPPVDTAQDLLFLQRPQSSVTRFYMIPMTFPKRGCGSYAVQFGNPKELVLGLGDMHHAGNHMYLSWM